MKSDFFKKFAISSGISIILTGLIFFLETKLSLEQTPLTAARKFCDGFFVSGIIMLFFSIFIFTVQKGTFYFLNYTFYLAKNTFTNIKSPEKLPPLNYADFCNQKNQNKKEAPLPSFICGILFILLSLICLFF